MEDAKGVASPGTKDEGTTRPGRDDRPEYGPANYDFSLVARLNYLAPGRADIAFSVNELARTMGKPTEGCWDKLRRLGRYTMPFPRWTVHYLWQPIPQTLKIHADAG